MHKVCNCCKKELNCENGIIREGYAVVKIEWGYFSDKDGEIHQMTLCETCYDKITAQFLIPVCITTKTEML